MTPLRTWLVAIATPAICLALQDYPDCANGPKALTTNLVCNTHATAAARAAAIIAAMNITEKLDNLRDKSTGSVRLGLPAYEWWSEALHGLGASPGVVFSESGDYSYATSFPMPILLSAAFNDNLVQDVASVISTEARAFSNAGRAGLDFFTPNINPFRDPRWGRGSETPGEDPFRIQGYVKNLLAGLEDRATPRAGQFKKVIATCKHFAGYDLEDWDGNVRYGFDALITTQDLAEFYLPPFQTCARDMNVGSIMCSYNAVNGVPTCANTYLMTDILREHWGWKVDNNYITSDCNAVHNIYGNHGYTTSDAAAEGVALTAGCDQSCEAGNPTNITGAFYGGFVTERVIDQALRRQYEALVIAGYFDPASTNPYRSIGWEQVDTPSTQSLARQAAVEGITLLKNDGTLPYNFLNGTNGTVAMIGMWANGTTQMQGSYSGIAPYLHSPLFAAEQLGLRTIYADGPINQSTLTSNFSGPAMDAAKQAEIILFFGGIDNSVEAEGQDRYQISWPESQLSLLKSLSSLGKPVVVVQMGTTLDSSPLLTNPNISAIVWAGYPGQDGGVAVFDILTGAVSPAGRLPITQYPATYVDEVPMTNMTLRPGQTSPGRTYKWYDGAVLPFGHGLHYTNFTVEFTDSVRPRNIGRTASGRNSGLTEGASYDVQDMLSRCKTTHLDLCSFNPVSILLHNTGKRSSDFVALAFMRTTSGPAPFPLKTLASYTRLSSVPGGSKQSATLDISLGTLARRQDNGDLVLYPGQYELLLDEPTQNTIRFSLTGKAATLEKWPQPPANETYAATKDCHVEGPC